MLLFSNNDFATNDFFISKFFSIYYLKALKFWKIATKINTLITNQVLLSVLHNAMCTLVFKLQINLKQGCIFFILTLKIVS